MSATILLAGLRRRNFAVTLNATADGVTVEPRSKLTEADRKAIRTHLAALTGLVRDAAPWDPQPHWEPSWPWYERFQRHDWYLTRAATASYEDES